MLKKLLNIVKYKLARFRYSGEKFAQTYNISSAIERGVKVGKGCRFYSTNFSSEPYLIEIGDHVTVTEGVQFITHDGAAWVLRGLKEEYRNINILGKIKIGNNVFIGFNSLILPGVEIGDNCVVAAGSIVTKSFGDGVVIGGSPAKVLKTIEEYTTLNEEYLVNTKQFNEEEKRKFILEEMKECQFRKK